MAVHELVTNAGKHGSLSEPGGQVDVTWSVARTEQGLTLVLVWKETGGPVPRRSRKPGFGTRLINMVIERQLNGKVEQSFRQEGLDIELTVPLTHERWPGGVRATAGNLPSSRVQLEWSRTIAQRFISSSHRSA
jgi:two-component sensor histidine kinase